MGAFFLAAAFLELPVAIPPPPGLPALRLLCVMRGVASVVFLLKPATNGFSMGRLSLLRFLPVKLIAGFELKKLNPLTSAAEQQSLWQLYSRCF